MEKDLENKVNGTVAAFIDKYEQVSFVFSRVASHLSLPGFWPTVLNFATRIHSWIFFMLSFFFAWLYQYKEMI